jgi:Cu2+-containing amine oxidase
VNLGYISEEAEISATLTGYHVVHGSWSSSSSRREKMRIILIHLIQPRLLSINIALHSRSPPRTLTGIHLERHQKCCSHRNMSPSHPLDGLSVNETKRARQLILEEHPDSLINFREIFLSEPRKAELVKFLAIEHSGKLDDRTPRPPRHAKCFYDVILPNQAPSYRETLVELEHSKVVSTEIIDTQQHASLTL